MSVRSAAGKDPRCQAGSILGWGGGRHRRSGGFSGSAAGMPRGVLLRGPASSRHEGRVNTWAVAATSPKCTSSGQASLRRASGRRAVFVLNDPRSKEWEKIRNLSLENHSQIVQIFEKTGRIQDLAQFCRQATTPQRQLVRTRV